jgi:hypothetical protein
VAAIAATCLQVVIAGALSSGCVDPSTTAIVFRSPVIFLPAFFSQEDAVDSMASDKEQTTTTTPLGDDPTAFNIVEATFHHLGAAHPEPFSLQLTSSPVELHAMATRLLKPLG